MAIYLWRRAVACALVCGLNNVEEMASSDYQDHRCAPAQSQEPHAGDSAGEAGRDHGDERLGKVLARLRHALRRGPAPLRRESVGLRAAVSRPDAEAGRGFHRGALAGHRHRAAHLRRQSALDHRHDDGNLRLPAPALLVRRPAARSGDRRAHLQAHAAADRRSDPRLSRRRAASSLLAPIVEGEAGSFATCWRS